MALLLTKPYDPTDTAAWVGDALKLSQAVAEAEQRRAEHRAALDQAALQDKRRAFEFNRRMEFERAKDATDNERADRLLRLQELQNEPINFGQPSPSQVASEISLPLPESDPAASIPAGGMGDLLTRSANAGANDALPTLGLQIPNPNAAESAASSIPAALLDDPRFNGAAPSGAVRQASGALVDSGTGEPYVAPPVDLLSATNATGGTGWAQDVPSLGEAPSGDGWRVAKQATQFGMVRNGSGGLMDDPQDPIDQAKRIPGFDKNKGAYGHNIKDPSLLGIALSPGEMAAAGLNPDKPQAMVEVSANGKTFRVPIVDKLGTPGKVDLTGGLFKALGGPDDPRGSIEGLRYRIIPRASDLGSDRTPDNVPASQTVPDFLADLQRRGVPVTRANLPALINVAERSVRERSGSRIDPNSDEGIAARVRVARELSDVRPRNIDPNSEEGIAARIRVAEARDPYSDRAVDAKIRVGTELAKARAKTNAAGDALTWEGETAFTKGGKAYRYDDNGLLQPVTGRAAYGTPEEQIAKDGFKPVGKPGMENVVMNEAGTALQEWSTGSNGKVKYKPFSSAGKIEHLGDTIVRIMPDHRVETIATVQKVAPMEQAKLTEAMQAHAKSADELLLARESKYFTARNIKLAQDKVARTSRDLRQYIIKYPFLEETVGKALTDDPSEGLQPVASDSSEEAAFKAQVAAAKSGDILTFRGKQYRKP